MSQLYLHVGDAVRYNPHSRVMNSGSVSHRPDRAIAWAGFLIGLVVTAFNLIHSNEYLLTMGPLLAVSCTVHLVLTREQTPLPHLNTAGRLCPARLQVLPLIVLPLCNIALASFLISSAQPRPALAFLLYACTAGFTAVHAAHPAHSRLGIAMLIVQVILLGLFARSSAYYQFPAIPGIDSSSHAAVIAQYLESGRIPLYYSSLQAFNYYASLPLGHILSAMAQLLSGATIKSAMFIAWTTPQVLTSLAVFVVGRRLFDNSTGILAMLLATTADYQIAWGAANPIAMTCGLALFSTVLLTTVGHTQTMKTTSALLVFLMAAIVFTHTVTYFIVMVFFALLVVANPLYRSFYPLHSAPTRLINPGIFPLSVVFALLHSRFAFILPTETSFLERQLAYWLDSITNKAVLLNRSADISSLAGTMPAVLNISGQLLLFGLGALGCLLLAQPSAVNARRFSLLTLLVVMIGLPLSFPLFAIANIQPTRWPAFYYLILGIPAATALLAYSMRLPRSVLRNAAVFVVTGTAVFLMATNSVSNPGSPFYTHAANEPTTYLASEEEVATFLNAATGVVRAEGRLGSHLRNTFSLDPPFSKHVDAPRGSDPFLLLWRERSAGRPVAVYSEESGYHLTVLPQRFPLEAAGENTVVYRSQQVHVFSSSSRESSAPRIS